jgi:hypothetical protein
VKTLEDWKIKIAALWIVFEFGAIATPILELYLPGFAEELVSGLVGGSPITPELILVMAIGTLIPPIMVFLSLVLKDSMNRWANIIVGIVFAVFAIVFGPVAILEGTLPYAYYASSILIGIVQSVAVVLIVWYAWKSKQKA